MKLSLFATILASASFTGSTFAGLMIDISELAGGGIRFEWSGSGTLSSSNGIGDVVNLNNASSGSAFEADYDFKAIDFGTLEFRFEGMTSTGFETFLLGNSGNSDQDDISFNPTGIGSLSDGGSWEASGFFETTFFSFSDLNEGSYTLSDSDAAAFGGVTLNISAIPEPSSILPFGALLVLVVGMRRRRL